MKLSEINLYDIIYIKRLDLTSIVIGKKPGLICLGLNKIIYDSAGLRIGRTINNNYNLSEEAKKFKFGWWFDDKEIYELANDKPIQNESQVCVDCNMPAPHAKSNILDDKFICSVCIIIRELL